MWIWTSSALLATLLVSGLSFPHPDDSEYNIPEVGTGGRAQYYVLHRDGTFKYGFDTGDGAYESAKSKMVGFQSGSFGYRTPEGDHIHLEYEAGENGFVARGDHLPVPSQNLAQAMAAVVRRTEKFVDPLASSGADASYSFQFDSDDHSRSESSSSDGTVTGSYSYTDENGVLRTFSYRAGKGIGFEITGDGLTLPTTQGSSSSSSSGFRSGSSTSYSSGSTGATRTSHSAFGSASAHGGSPAVSSYRAGSTTFTSGARPSFGEANIRSSSGDDGSYSFSYDNNDHSRSESGSSDNKVVGEFDFVAADDGKRRELSYEAGSETGFIVDADHLPVGPPVPGAEDGKPSGAFARYQDKNFVDPLANTASDSSYQFGFDSDTYSRSETSDKDGNIVGTYTVVEDDGTRVTNKFRAGAGIGYEVSEVSRTSGPRPAPRRTHQTSTAGAAQTHGTSFKTSGASSVSHGAGHSTFRAGSGSQANTQANFGDDGSYSFNYNTDSHHRAESGANGRVTGDFSFVAADDGQRRALTYEAGSDTGFIVNADHLPVGPSVPGAEDGKPSGAFARYQDKNFVDPLANTASDSSYQFGFDSDTYSRSETSDKDGNVVGTYTVVEDDGTRVTNKFRAGAGIGYEVSEVSRSAGPRPATRKSYQASSGAQAHGFRASTSGSSSFSHGGSPATYRDGSDEEANTHAVFGDDGSYSFTYSTDSHDRSESGANGRVTGDFSFVAADDGQRRALTYEAGSDTGFIVSGDHLPVGPSVPGAEDGQPSGAFARHQNKNFVDPLAKKAPSAHFRQSSVSSGSANVRASSAGASIRHQPTPYSTRRFHSSSSSASSSGGSSSVHKHNGHAHRSSFMKKPSHTVLRSSDFTLNQYAPDEDADKFGYVIRYH